MKFNIVELQNDNCKFGEIEYSNISNLISRIEAHDYYFAMMNDTAAILYKGNYYILIYSELKFDNVTFTSCEIVNKFLRVLNKPTINFIPRQVIREYEAAYLRNIENRARTAFDSASNWGLFINNVMPTSYSFPTATDRIRRGN